MPPTPKSWPSSVTYIHQPVHSQTLTSQQISTLTRQPSLSRDGPIQIRPARTPSHVQIRTITSLTHPAHSQCGLFATRHLPPASFILVYLGYVHGASDTDESSDYDISLDREEGISVDAAKMGNEARFINDYRGVRADGPNAEFRDCWVALERGGAEKCIGVFVLPAGKSGKRAAGIAKGEEVLVSYGRGFWRERAVEGHAESEALNGAECGAAATTTATHNV